MSADDDTEIYVRKDAAPAAPPAAKRATPPAAAPPTPAPVDEITLGGEDVEVHEPRRAANPDPGPFGTFLNQPKAAPKKDTPANRPLPASTDDVEVYVGRQPKPEERIASTAETGQFLIAPSEGGDGTYSYPTKPKAKETKPAPTTSDPNLKSTVDAIHQKRSTAESGAFLIPPSSAGGGAMGDSFYEYPSKPRESTADAAAKSMVYRGPMSDDGSILYEGKPKEPRATTTPDGQPLRTTMMYKGPATGDGSILYEGKPREIPRHDLERAKPTESSSDGTELYVGHKPTRSVQGIESNNNFVLYGGKVEAAKPGIKPGPPTEGPNANKYYANPTTAPGNKMVERTSQFDLYESTPKPTEQGPAAPPLRPSWQDGNAVLYTSKDPSQRAADKYPSLVNLKPDRGYDRSVSDSNGFILYEKPKAPREAPAPKPVGTSDASNGYIYYEKSKTRSVETTGSLGGSPEAKTTAAAMPPAPVAAPVAASSGYELYEEKKPAAALPAVAPFVAPALPEPVPAAPPQLAPVEPPVTGPVAEEEDFEVFERAPPAEPEPVAEATLDLVGTVAEEPVGETKAPEPVAEPMLEMPLAAAEPVAEPVELPMPPLAEPVAEPVAELSAESTSVPVVEQAEVVEAAPEPAAPMFDPMMLDASPAPPAPDPPALAIPFAPPPAVVAAEEPDPVMIDIIETADVTRIAPEDANVDPAPALTDPAAESKLEGVDVLEAPLAPLPLEFALGNMPRFPTYDTMPTELPGFESRHLPAAAPTSPETGLEREEPTSEYVPKDFTLEASGRDSVTMRIGFVVSEFNYDITTMMLERAKAHAEFLGAKLGPVLHVPGTFDMGLAVKKLISRKDVDGVVTLGAVIQGETDHDQVVLQHASRKIADLSIEFGKPVALGITGPGMTRLQAMERIDRAKDAVEAVVKLHQRLKVVEAS